MSDAEKQPSPIEAVVLRSTGFGWLIVIAIVSFPAHPHAGFHPRGTLILLGLILVAVSGPLARPWQDGAPGSRPITTKQTRTILALCGVIAGSGMLALLQSDGIGAGGPYLRAITAATQLDRKPGAIMLFFGTVPFCVGALIDHSYGTALTTSVGIIP